MRRPPLRLDDGAKYTVMVLWLHGYSIARVAMAASKFAGIPIKPDQIRGVIRNSPYYRRAEMDIGERQNHLDILAGDRLDRGRIRPFAFRAAVLKDGRQR